MPLESAFRAALLRLISPHIPCVVAYSGGLDSHVLLHLVVRLARIPVRAIHVHHGLQAKADDWAEHCAVVCRELQVPLDIFRVDARVQKGQSPEEAARTARYGLLRESLREGEVLLTAQHADDQAETLLLQLLRGAGVHGLAAMAEKAEFGRGWLARPLLGFSRAELRDYATTHHLSWVEDASNADESFDRNFLRRQVMPLLRQRWPAAPQVLARSAAHCAEAARILDERAGDLLQKAQGATESGLRSQVADVTEPPALASLPLWGRTGGGEFEAPSPLPSSLEEAGKEGFTTATLTLPIAPLLELAESDQRLVLRAWLRANGFRMPAARILERVLREAIPARPGRTPCVAWSEGEIRRYRDALYLMKPLSAVPPRWRSAWTGDEPLLLPDGRTLHALQEKGAGIAPEFWQFGKVEVRYRNGGERCRLPGRTGSHELKKLLQEVSLAPWERERLPLVYLDGRLAAVGDLWVCGEFAGEAERVNVRLCFGE